MELALLVVIDSKLKRRMMEVFGERPRKNERCRRSLLNTRLDCKGSAAGFFSLKSSVLSCERSQSGFSFLECLPDLTDSRLCPACPSCR